MSEPCGELLFELGVQRSARLLPFFFLAAHITSAYLRRNTPRALVPSECFSVRHGSLLVPFSTSATTSLLFLFEVRAVRWIPLLLIPSERRKFGYASSPTVSSGPWR